jgi:hypothetical protein
VTVWEFVLVCVLMTAQVTLAVIFAVKSYQFRKYVEKEYGFRKR